MLETPTRLCPLESGANLPSKGFSAFYAQWNAARGSQDMPDVSRLVPSALPSHLLPSMAIIGVDHEPDRLVVRLAGSRVLDATGVEFTNWEIGSLSALPRHFRANEIGTSRFDTAVAKLNWVVERGQPACGGGSIPWARKAHMQQRTLMLPYKDASGQVARLLTLSDFMVTDPCDGCGRNCQAQKEARFATRALRTAATALSLPV